MIQCLTGSLQLHGVSYASSCFMPKLCPISWAITDAVLPGAKLTSCVHHWRTPHRELLWNEACYLQSWTDRNKLLYESHLYTQQKLTIHWQTWNAPFGANNIMDHVQSAASIILSAAQKLSLSLIEINSVSNILKLPDSICFGNTSRYYEDYRSVWVSISRNRKFKCKSNSVKNSCFWILKEYWEILGELCLSLLLTQFTSSPKRSWSYKISAINPNTVT